MGRLLPGGLQVPDYFLDLDPLDMSLFGGLGALRCPLGHTCKGLWLLLMLV